VDLLSVGPTTTTPDIPRGGVVPTPIDPLKGLKDTNVAPPEGHGVRAKRPSLYACQILTGKGSTTRETDN